MIPAYPLQEVPSVILSLPLSLPPQLPYLNPPLHLLLPILVPLRSLLKKKGKYICKYCGLGLRSEDNLFRHEMTAHLDPEGYKEGRLDFAGRTGARLVSPRTSPTSRPRRKSEKYHCQFCLDSFPTREQRDMHEVNKHNAWLHHPSFLAPKLPDRIFSYDW